MHDLPPLPATPTLTEARTVGPSPKTPLRPSPTPHQPRYTHPYGVKSTSSGVLSSAAISSSPNNAISAHSYQQHKSSKSVHSLLRNSSSANDLDQIAESHECPPMMRDKQRSRNEGVLSPMKYDSINTRKRTLAQRASMSDLSAVSHAENGVMELDALSSPRKRVTELREEWSRVGIIRAEGGRSGLEITEPVDWRDTSPANPREWTTAQLEVSVESRLSCNSSTKENEGSDQVTVKSLGAVVMQPRVRALAEILNRGLHVGGPSRASADDRREIFSPQTRYKLRTLSSSSSVSAASVCSSAPSEKGCVSETAALFESGHVASKPRRTAEEREGRVLKHEGPLKSLSTGPLGFLEGQTSEDVFGATIKPNLAGRRNEDPKHTSAVVTDQETMVVHLNETAGDFVEPNGLITIADPADVDTQHIQDIVKTCSPDSSDDTEANTVALTQDTSKEEPQATSLITSILPPNFAKHGMQESQLPLEAAPPVEVDAQPGYMSHMIAHEQAGRKPYGALRRTHSTPVPQLGNDQKAEVNILEHASMPVSQFRYLSTQLGARPLSDFEFRFVSQSVSQPPDDPNGPSRGISFDATEHTNLKSQATAFLTPLCDQDSVMAISERLAAAEHRITQLELLLANVVGDVVGDGPPTSKCSPSRHDTLVGRPEAGEKSSDPDAIPTTVFWGWLTTPRTLYSSASRFGPPQTLRQLPGYVLLVGVGLSVIVARVAQSRSLTQGK